MSYYNYKNYQEYDFGEGKVIAKQPLDFEVEFYDENPPNTSNNNIQSNNKPRLNQYKRKKITQRKLKKLHRERCYSVWNRGKYYDKYYLSGRKKVAKKITNKKLRQYKGYVGDGGNYRKFHDYWWNIF